MARKAACAVGVASPGSDLPVVGTGALAHVRRSRNARRRAWVLLAVHLLIAAHVTHYLVAGRTLSPVEPSEAMATLELGRVNAGFVFLLVALAGTLIFGRFFCGWACHLVALQDACGWLMKRLGVRPQPLRSRALAWVPLAVAFYMFAWPTLRRWLLDPAPAAFPGFTNHLTTAGFWDTFPGPLCAVLTLGTCGFAAVYLLGAKGFCTYGCPYGALFGAADRLAPAAIVVSDACEQCGHCTATCTSNVLVHDEVRRYGRVVDPGCMKCMDCVSVCPKGALSWGWAKPSLLVRRNTSQASRHALAGYEEAGIAAVAAASTLAFRGLYDGPPLLLAVGLGGITAYAALKLWQLARRPSVRVQRLSLKVAGTWSPAGRVFAAAAGLWLVFAAHSGFVQWHRAWGRVHLERTEAGRDDVLAGTSATERYSARHERSAARSFEHFALADRFGLARTVEVELGLAWGHLLRNEDDEGAARLRGAIELAPREPALHEHLVAFLGARGRNAELASALESKLASVGPSAADHFRLGGALVGLGRDADAVSHYRRSLELAPTVAETRYNLGGLLRRMGRNGEAVTELQRASALAPQDPDVQVEIGLALAAEGRTAEALVALRRAIDLAPDRPESRLHLPEVIRQLEAGR